MNKRRPYKYENVLFGRKEELRVNPFYPGYFHLTNTISALKGVSGKLLDVGCGQGATSKAIKKYCPSLDVYAVDVSRASLRQAKKNPSGVKFTYGGAYKIPFKTDIFNAIITLDVMEHLEEPQRALEEIKRVLKPRGMLVISCPTEGNITTLHGILWRVFGLNLKEKHVGHVQMYTLGKLRSLLEDNGFEMLSYKWSNYFFNQVVDLSQFILMYMLGRGREEGVRKGSKGKDEESQNRLKDAIYKLGILINFLESKTFSFIPGQTVHIQTRLSRERK